MLRKRRHLHTLLHEQNIATTLSFSMSEGHRSLMQVPIVEMMDSNVTFCHDPGSQSSATTSNGLSLGEPAFIWCLESRHLAPFEISFAVRPYLQPVIG